MANQVIVTNTGNVQVALTPPPNVQVQISRAAIGTVSNVPTANFANYAGNVTASNQPNITSVGTLGNLSVANTITTLNLNVTGNLSVGNLIANSANYANFAGIANLANSATVANSANSVAGANVSGAVNLANFATTANSVAGANVIGAVADSLHSNVADVANLVAGANVSGAVAFATTANSVAVGNVSGIGNIATVNLDGNAGNILYGNGIFAAVPNVSNVANANYANFAGTAFSVAGSNVSGEVANANYASFANTANLATFATTANAVAGANVSGEVANANYSSYSNIASTANSVAVGNVSGIGNIATTNYDGNASNVLYGNGGFYALPTISNVANANYANFAGEAFNVNASNITGTVANANFAAYSEQANNANLATFATTANAVAGANVSGVVANANYSAFANIAASANSVALANVSGIGNIANINLDGSSSNVLFGNGVFAPESTSIANANYANFAGTAYSVSGANVSGEVANANYASFANVAASANSVAVGNVSGIGNIATINLDGNAGNILYGNGAFAAVPNVANVANANYANFAGTAFNVAGANVSGEVANANYASFANIASTANSVAGANVSGIVANANYASFANIASTANSATQVLTTSQAGTGFLVGTTVTSGNANLGVASTTIGYSGGTVSAGAFQSNNLTGTQPLFVSSTTLVPNLHVARANIADTANSVAVANVVGIGNIATVNLTGSSSNVLYGNGVFAPESTSIANANFANFAGNVTNSAQPNITSLGTLTGLNVTGNSNIDGVLTLSLNSGSLAKITALSDAVNANSRSLFLQAGDITSANLANGNSAGSLSFLGGSAYANTDPGSRWNAIGSGASILGGSGISANGSANGGGGSITAGSGFSNLFPATGGIAQMTGGRAQAANANSTGGNVTLLSGRANSTTTGTATSGNINLVIGNVVGASGNVRGNINIGSLAPLSTTTFPGAINIGQANTPTNIGGNANIAGNLNVVGTITGNVTANFANFAGNVTVSSQPNITSVGTLTSLSVSGDANVTGNVNSQGSGLFNSPANNTDTLKLVSDNRTNMNMIRMERYGDTANLGGIGTFNMYRTGGNQAVKTAVANNDVVYNLTTSVYGDSGNIFVDTGGFVIRVGTNYGNGTVTSIAEYNQGSGGSGSVDFNYDTINFNGNVTIASGKTLTYDRTFGSFTSNATQTNGNVGNAVYMTLNNDEGSNGVSIVSSSQITVARTGRYNLQFSAQLEKTDSGTDQVEIWLTKNGSAVANSATQLELAGNGAKAVAAWNWVDQVTSANTYYQIAWGSTDANVQLTAIPSANTLSGVAVPSVIVTVVPVGA
jgi:hypothetical protein